MNRKITDHGLEFLLAFDGRIHHLERGYWLKFEISRSDATFARPHGLSYSFTLHAPDGKRLVASTMLMTYTGAGLDSSVASKPAITGTVPRRIQVDRMFSRTRRR